MWTERELTLPKSRRNALNAGWLVDITERAQRIGYFRKIALSRELCDADDLKGNGGWLDTLAEMLRMTDRHHYEMRLFDPSLVDPAKKDGPPLRAVLHLLKSGPSHQDEPVTLLAVFGHDHRGLPCVTVLNRRTEVTNRY